MFIYSHSRSLGSVNRNGEWSVQKEFRNISYDAASFATALNEKWHSEFFVGFICDIGRGQIRGHTIVHDVSNVHSSEFITFCQTPS